MLHGQRNDSGSTVAEGQTLHDTQDTDAVECPCGFPQLGAEADALRGRSPVITEPREPADTHTNEEDEYGTFQNLHAGGTAEFEIILFQGDVCGNSHDEHEERKYKVGGGKTVPFRMTQGGIDMCPCTGVVNHNHACNGDTAKDVEGKDALVCFYCTTHDFCVLS